VAAVGRRVARIFIRGDTTTEARRSRVRRGGTKRRTAEGVGLGRVGVPPENFRKINVEIAHFRLVLLVLSTSGVTPVEKQSSLCNWANLIPIHDGGTFTHVPPLATPLVVGYLIGLFAGSDCGRFMGRTVCDIHPSIHPSLFVQY